MLGKHLLGIYEKALDKTDDWYVRMNKARDLGFDYLEVSIDETDERLSRIYAPDKDIFLIQDAANKAGVRLKTMCLSVHRKYPFGSADSKIREKAKDIMEKALIFADKVGINVIQLAGYDVYYEPSTSDSLKRYEEGMFWAASEASKYQIMLGTEIMDTELMSSISRHLVYEKKINSPWYKVYPDMGNITAWDYDVLADIEGGIHSIVGMHVKETIKKTADKPGVFRDVPFGEGDVDFTAVFKKLEELGYTGPYMMEMWHQPGMDDVAEVRRSKAYVEDKFNEAMAKIGA